MLDQERESTLEDLAAETERPQAGPEYWAAEKGDTFISSIKQKERAYFEFAQRRGYYGMWSAMIEEHYGVSASGVSGFDAQSVSYTGQEGELTRFRVAELRSHIRQVVAMNTKNRPAFKATPTNMDYDSRAEIEAAESVIEYIYKSTYGERKEREAAELSDLFGTSYTWIQWDPDGGQELFIPEEVTSADGVKFKTGKTNRVKVGQIVKEVLLPWDQFSEPLQRDLTKHTWRGVRQRRSKWEVAASFPKFAAEIKAMSAREEIGYAFLFGFDDASVSTDDVIVKHFYHARTPALPDGRYVIYIGTIVLYDSNADAEVDPTLAQPPAPKRKGLPYAKVPIVPLQGSQMIGSALGYSDSWDLMVLQQMLTQTTSDAATTQSTLGRPAMFMDKGTDIDEDALVNGTFLMTKAIGADPPAYVQPPAVPESSFRFIELILKFFREISGLNAVVRGDTSSEIKSGQHAALYHAVAQEFQTERIASLNLHREEVANMDLDILKRFAEHPFMAEIAGIDERNHIKAFTREKFMSIRRVTLESVRPQNIPQQMEVAEFIKDIGGGFITMEQAVEFLHTGKLKPVTRSAHSKMLRVQWENDALATGGVTVTQQPGEVDMATGLPTMEEITPEIPVFPTDDPFVHVPEVLSLLDSPEAVNNAELRQAVFAHVAWHMRVYAQMTPDMCQVLHIPPPTAGMAALQGMVEDHGNASRGKPSSGADDEQVGDLNMKLPKPAQPPQGANINA